MEVNKKQLGKRIKDIRVNSCNSTMEEFGNLVGAGKSNVSRWERGENIPNDLTLKKIAELGNVSTEYLLYGDIREYFYNVIYKNSEKFNAKLGNTSPLKLFDGFFENVEKILEDGSPFYPEPDYILQSFNTYIDTQQKGVDKLWLAYKLFQSRELLIKLIDPLKEEALKDYLNGILREVNGATAAFENYFNTSIEEEVVLLKEMMKNKE